jgi:hypothetical protein
MSARFTDGSATWDHAIQVGAGTSCEVTINTTQMQERFIFLKRCQTQCIWQITRSMNGSTTWQPRDWSTASAPSQLVFA